MSNKLKGLDDSLTAFVLCSKATSSNVKYKNAWLIWKKWEKDNEGYNQFPVSLFLFCLYLREKVESCNSPAPIEAAFYAVRWAHEIAGASSPTECSLVKQVFEASKRLLGKPVQGKQSVDVHLVTKVAEKFNIPQASILTLELVLYLLLLLLVSCVVTKLFASTEVIFLFFLIIGQFFVLCVRMINVLKGISFILQGQARLHVLFSSLKKCHLNCLIILFSL